MEGGSQNMQNVRAAAKHALKCLAMNGPWIRENPMTERIDFLFLEVGFAETMKQSWELYEKYSQAPRKAIGESARTGPYPPTASS
eukprot:161559-Alexandrium_andersonii.AAC.1